MAATFPLEVYTPYRLFFYGPVESFILTIADGEIGIEANHASFTAPVMCCAARIKDDAGVWKNAFISDGIIEVKERKTVLLTDAAEWPDEIDYERVLHAKEEAENILKTASFHFESAAAKQKALRAAIRLKVLSISGRGAN
jgi:F-type H+-transporting ATPase subunit epsilon